MKNSFRIFLPLLMALLASLPATAAPPKTLSYQGVLTNNAAVPVNGTPSMLFSLYDVASGGTALWTETQPSVGVANGLFNVTLGSVTSIPLAFDVPYFLGVKVDTDAEMIPRQPLAASAYAFTALGLDASATVPGSAVVGPITSGGGNIAIGHVGAAAEANTTRIGTSQTRAFMAGVSGVNVSGVAVFVDAAGQLGISTSSRRFKENIASMDDASADLMRLNPVTFNYLDGQDDGRKLTQYGLIAEEVAEVYPDLVVKTPDGKAETVRYHFLTPMLLNEMQKQQRKLVAQESHAERQAAELQRQAGELAAQREKVAAMESELAAIKAILNHR
jgi:hypothetical protein